MRAAFDKIDLRTIWREHNKTLYVRGPGSVQQIDPGHAFFYYWVPVAVGSGVACVYQPGNVLSTALLTSFTLFAGLFLSLLAMVHTLRVNRRGLQKPKTLQTRKLETEVRVVLRELFSTTCFAIVLSLVGVGLSVAAIALEAKAGSGNVLGQLGPRWNPTWAGVKIWALVTVSALLYASTLSFLLLVPVILKRLHAVAELDFQIEHEEDKAERKEGRRRKLRLQEKANPPAPNQEDPPR